MTGFLRGQRAMPCILLLALATTAHRTFAADPLPKKASLVEEFDRLGFPPLQQGNQDSCGTFAMTSIVEFESQRATPTPHQPLSEAYLLWAACRATGKTREQSMFYEITDAINKEGLCTAAEMPYQNNFDLKRQPSAQAIATSRSLRERWEFHWIRYWTYDPALSDHQMEQIKRALSDKHPVAIGVRWPSSSDNATVIRQLVDMPAAKDVFDGHAIALVGYADDPQKPGGGTFTFRNSFGPDWADHGYGTLSYAYARKYANDVVWMHEGAPRSAVPTQTLEAEAMRQLSARRCTTSVQDMSTWEAPLWSGGKQLFCQAQQRGSVELALPLPKGGQFRVTFRATAAPDYGIVRVDVDGQPAGTFDLYAGRVCPSGDLELGNFDFTPGEHRLSFTATDKNSASQGYSFGLDAVDLFAIATK